VQVARCDWPRKVWLAGVGETWSSTREAGPSVALPPWPFAVALVSTGAGAKCVSGLIDWVSDCLAARPVAPRAKVAVTQVTSSSMTATSNTALNFNTISVWA
jgi:hypothetical protein